ncbi:MAG: HPr kinase/phosphatase C-terminal domain-containing protein [Rhodobiaceae bacterium]|nr:HPr kinase/phosphatase C-terminal domain-containing protein [Rhodobiaceae bacterium]
MREANADRMDDDTIHATAVAIGEKAVILRGPAGSGKSRLAFALINRGTPRTSHMLIGDDRIHACAANGRLVVSGHERVAGLIELRGAGIIRLPFLARAVAGLVVDCHRAPERLPEGALLWADIRGVKLPRAFVDPTAGDAADRVIALSAIARDVNAWNRLGDPALFPYDD